MTGLRPISVAIIDDRPASLELMEAALRRDDLQLHCFADAELGLEFILDRQPQVVLTDIVMPGLSGMELLERVVEFDPSIDVVLMTAFYSTESAVEAIRKGAADYLDKPITPHALRTRLAPLFTRHRARLAALELEKNVAENAVFAGMVGNSPAMWHLYSQIQRMAPHYRTILVTGQTGTGKELIARLIHRYSRRSDKPFVAVDCGSIPPSLLESELFGALKGSFTGADRDRVGVFEAANHGTIFLDEIGDIDLNF